MPVRAALNVTQIKEEKKEKKSRDKWNGAVYLASLL